MLIFTEIWGHVGQELPTQAL